MYVEPLVQQEQLPLLQPLKSKVMNVNKNYMGINVRHVNMVTFKVSSNILLFKELSPEERTESELKRKQEIQKFRLREDERVLERQKRKEEKRKRKEARFEMRR